MSDHSPKATKKLQIHARDYIAATAKRYGLTLQKFAELGSLTISQASCIRQQSSSQLAIEPHSLAELSKNLTHVSIHEMHYGVPKSVRLPKTMNLMALRMEAADKSWLRDKREEWDLKYPLSYYARPEQSFSDLYRERIQEQADDAGMTLRRYCCLDRLLEMDGALSSIKINSLKQEACAAWEKNLPCVPTFFAINLVAANSDQPLDYFMTPNYIETGCAPMYCPLDKPRPLTVENPDTIRVLSDYLNRNPAGRLELFTAVCTEL